MPEALSALLCEVQRFPSLGNHCLCSASATLQLYLYIGFIASSLGLLLWADAACCPAQGSTMLGCLPHAQEENFRAARGVGIRQLGCGTGIPLNSTSLVSLLYRRHRAVCTEGGDQPWGGRWESAKETMGWAPKMPGRPAEPPRCFASCMLLCKWSSERERKLSKSFPACVDGPADGTKIETAWPASPPTPALPQPQHADGGGSPSAFHPRCSRPSVLLFGSPAKCSDRLFKSVLLGFLITRRQIIYCSGK